jgi:hypothetical protein
MRCVRRGVRCLLTAVALVAGASALLRERDRVPGLGAVDSPPLFLTPDEEEREERVQAEIERSQQRIRAKRAAAQEFIAGRLTLREAAARFREADAGLPESQLARWREASPGACATDDDRYCWTVVRYVECEAWHDPQHGPAALQRLVAELPDHLRALLVDSPEFR